MKMAQIRDCNTTTHHFIVDCHWNACFTRNNHDGHISKRFWPTGCGFNLSFFFICKCYTNTHTHTHTQTFQFKSLNRKTVTSLVSVDCFCQDSSDDWLMMRQASCSCHSIFLCITLTGIACTKLMCHMRSLLFAWPFFPCNTHTHRCGTWWGACRFVLGKSIKKKKTKRALPSFSFSLSLYFLDERS